MAEPSSSSSLHFTTERFGCSSALSGNEQVLIPLRQTQTTNIKVLELSLGSRTEISSRRGAETILKFARESANLREVYLEISFGYRGSRLFTEQLEFVSDLTQAVRSNTKLEGFELKIWDVGEDFIDQACEVLNTSSNLVTSLTLLFEDRPPISHDRLVKLARRIGSVSGGLKTLHLSEFSAPTFLTIMDSLPATWGKWNNLRHLVLFPVMGTEKVSFSSLGSFLRSCAPNLEKLTIHSLLTSGQGMEHYAMQTLAKYLRSSDCKLKAIHMDVGCSYEENFHDIIVPALASSASITELQLTFDHRRQFCSKIMRDVLVQNNSLTKLVVELSNGPDTVICPDLLADGLRCNTTLRVLEFFRQKAADNLIFEAVGRVFKKIHDNLWCVGIEVLIIRYVRSINPKEISAFFSTLPGSVRSLHLKFCHTMEAGYINNFIQCISEKKTLQRIDLGCIPHRAVPSFVNAVAGALPNMNHLQHLSFAAWVDHNAHPQPQTYQNQILQPLLTAMRANHSLESLEIGWLVPFDESFLKNLQQICVRNRVHKIVHGFGNGSSSSNNNLPLSIVPRVLESIQKSCVQDNIDTALQSRYTASILFPFLKGIASPGTTTMDNVFAHLSGQSNQPHHQSDAGPALAETTEQATMAMQALPDPRCRIGESASAESVPTGTTFE